MSLTTGSGPLGPEPSGRFSAPIPTGLVYVEPYPRRIRARIGDRTVIDTERAQLVHRPGLPTSYAFPVDDVPTALAEPEPIVPGHVSVPWGGVDAWYEEDVHLAFQRYPKNPYHRVDCLAGSAACGSRSTASCWSTRPTPSVCTRPRLAPRLYVSKDAIRMELLTVNPTTTSWCSYKGHATWWNVTVSGVTLADVAWSYENPLPESVALGGMVSFDEQLATVLADLPGPGGEGRASPQQ